MKSGTVDSAGKLKGALHGSTTAAVQIAFLKKVKKRIVLLCEYFSSNTTWTVCFSDLQSFEKTSKYGKSGEGKQRYLCQDQECCGKTFIRDYSDLGRLPQIKEQIIEMSLNGSGIRDIARVLKISPSTVIEEIKKGNRTECGKHRFAAPA